MAPFATADEALGWLYGRQGIGIKLGLENMHTLMQRLGHPEQDLQFVHVAGTNGKGSVTRWMAAVLQGAGHRVGCYTSPHLIRFNERICINGEPISDADLARHLSQIASVMDDLEPTFFEITTALALLHFRAEGVAWVAWETGLGGRLDATNIVTPAVAVITNVDVDHGALLGNSVGEIAAEKAGIMKPGVPVVTGAQGDALTIVLATSHQQSCPVSIIGRDYLVEPADGICRIVRPTGEATYRLAASGAHQAINAALVVATVDALRARGHLIPEPAVAHAFATTAMPGRLERFVHQGSQVLVDGAHNVAAAAALRSHLATLDWAGFHLIVGFADDKPWREMLDQWMPLASRLTAVRLNSPRSVEPQDIVAAAMQPATVALTVGQALDDAADGRPILVAGSLFLAGAARAHLTGQPLEEGDRYQ